MINILLNGAKGNIGKAFYEYIYENCKYNSDFNLLYAIDRDNSDLFNQINHKPDVIIDFSRPRATFLALDYALKNLVPIVIATTGFSEEDEEKIKEFSEAIPIFKSSNMCDHLLDFHPLISASLKVLSNSIL